MKAAVLKALIVVTSHSQLGTNGKTTGWYLSEVSHVYGPLKEAGIQVDFASPKGGAAPMDPSSYLLDDKLNQSFIADSEGFEKIKRSLPLDKINPQEYQILFFAGGHGTMWDFATDENIQRLGAQIYENGGIIAAVCHGPAALINIRLKNGDYLIHNKNLTAFSNAEEKAVGLTNVVPFSLEDQLKARGGIYSKADLWNKKVVVDGRLITGQNPASAKSVGDAIVRVSQEIK